MVKKGLLLFAMTLALLWNTAGSVCEAAILPRHGEGQIGLQAVVLCETLTIRQEPDASSTALKKLEYGDKILIPKRLPGWAECLLSDAVDADSAGWVNSDYIVIDPLWYRTDGKTPVYAWNDEKEAPKVALLDEGATLPIVNDKGEWVIVSLRGGVGWIHKNAADKAAGETTEKPAEGSTEESSKESAEKPTEKPTESSDPETVSYKNGSYKLSAKGTATLLKPVKSAKSFQVPDTLEVNEKTYKVTAIGEKAFYTNKKLTKITIGKNVKTIGKNAFASCTKLSSVSLGSNVTTISDRAFYKCTALIKITIPSKVTKIGKSAFQNCKNLKAITIKTKKLKEKYVGNKAFKGIVEKATVKVPKNYVTAYTELLVRKGISIKAKVKK